MLLIRPATANDVSSLLAMIRELAEYEREPDAVTTRAEDLARNGFGANPKFRALIAEWNGQIAGFALFFPYYSTWAGPGMFLEDLFIRTPFRRLGIGTALMAAVGRVAVEEGCYGMKWEVLDWNENAIGLYKAMGAEFRESWKSMLLTGESLQLLAKAAK